MNAQVPSRLRQIAMISFGVQVKGLSGERGGDRPGLVAAGPGAYNGARASVFENQWGSYIWHFYWFFFDDFSGCPSGNAQPSPFLNTFGFPPQRHEGTKNTQRPDFRNQLALPSVCLLCETFVS